MIFNTERRWYTNRCYSSIPSYDYAGSALLSAVEKSISASVVTGDDGGERGVADPYILRITMQEDDTELLAFYNK